MNLTLRGISVGSLTLSPDFDPYTTEYTAAVTTTDAEASVPVVGIKRDTNQVFFVYIADMTPGCGARIVSSTGIGQRFYALKFGTGGDGGAATITLGIENYASATAETPAITYTVTIARQYSP